MEPRLIYLAVALFFSLKRCGKRTRTVLFYSHIAMRYFIVFSYDGTNYHGWQEQPNAVSVQQRLNEALATILRQPVVTTGAGRTDTGVHARKMVAHFDCDIEVPDDLCDRLNRLLPPDIAVSRITKTDERAHARFDATSRTYHYDIITGKDPFNNRFATRIYYDLDFERMNAAAELLLGQHDFTSFSKTGTDTKTNICTIQTARWIRISEHYYRFEITADRFLRNMVRAVVGTLFQVGRGRLQIEDIRRIIDEQDRCAAGESVPARGLSLVNVTYPYEI